MKIQLTYKFTGEDFSEVVGMLGKTRDILEVRGHDVYVPALDESMTLEDRESFENTFRHIDGCDRVLSIIRSSNKSEGQLLEVGYSRARGKYLFTFIREGAGHDRVIGLSDKVVVFQDMDDY